MHLPRRLLRRLLVRLVCAVQAVAVRAAQLLGAVVQLLGAVALALRAACPLRDGEPFSLRASQAL